MNDLELLNSLRKRKGFTLRKLSKATGYSVGYLGTICCGFTVKTPLKTKKRIAKALGEPVGIIFK